MKLFLFALAAAAGLATLPAQEPSPSPEPTVAAAGTEAANSPKMKKAVDLSETAPAENMEIPAPPDAPDPAKSGEISGDWPDEEKVSPPPPVTGKIGLTAADTGKVVRATVGNLITITLQSNPSTGYNWELRDFDYGAADFYGSETVPANEGNVLFGAPSKTVVTLQAVKPGTQDIKLVYRRLWEPPERVAETFAFRLEVTGAEAPAPTAAPSPPVSPAP